MELRESHINSVNGSGTNINAANPLTDAPRISDLGKLAAWPCLPRLPEGALVTKVKPHQVLDPQNHLTCTTEVLGVLVVRNTPPLRAREGDLIMNDYTCYTCGQAGHVASGCPQTKTWADCAECGQPGHPFRGDIGRDGMWLCRDCREPHWRTHLDRADQRRRDHGQPLRPAVAAPEDRPPLSPISEPGNLLTMNVDDLAKELAGLRQHVNEPAPFPSRERDAALRDLALQQVGIDRPQRIKIEQQRERELWKPRKEHSIMDGASEQA